MIPLDHQPVVVAATATSDGVIEFRTRTERITVDNDSEVINEILRLCDGRNTVAKIAKKIAKLANVSAEYIRAVIQDLAVIEVLVDSREYAVHAHKLGNNPMYYSRILSDEDVEVIYNNRPSYLVASRETLPIANNEDSYLRNLLDRRTSCRSFSDQSISYEDYITICEMAYGTELAPIPSGGALYPLSLFLLVARDGDGIDSGIYQYDPRANRLNMIETPLDCSDAMFALNSDTLLHNASGVIVVAGDLDRHLSKYANRGYRYTLLEAGHVAQCVNLSAIELGYSVLEYGGFTDEPLQRLFRMDSIDGGQVWPLVCVAIGVADQSVAVKASADATIRQELEKTLVGRSKPLNWVTILHKETEENTQFYSAAAHYKPGTFHDKEKSYRLRIAAGTSVSQDLALIKAMAEGFERYSFSFPYVDRIAPANELDAQWVDPNIHTPFTSWQRSQFGFDMFEPTREWQWVRGEDSGGGLVYVPTDLVFYPYDASTYGRRLCYAAHSNGCAAHTQLEDAKLNAVHELIERDAIIRNWLLRDTPDRIPFDLLPLHWKNRVIFWQHQGWRVDIVDFSHSGVAVVSVFARRKHERPYLAHGSAASSVDFVHAVDKAFQELEIAISVQSGRRSRRILPEKVDSPNDHGKVYHFDDYAQKLGYLFDGDFIDQIPGLGGSETIKQFDPIYVTVSSYDSPLQVVRALSEKLVPINFGYGRDHISHSAIRDRVDQQTVPFPHYLA